MRLLAVFVALCACLSFVAPLQGQDDTSPPDGSVDPLRDDAQNQVVVSVTLDGLETYDRDAVLKVLGVQEGQRWPAVLNYRSGVKRVFDTFGVIVLEPRFVIVAGGVTVTIPVQELKVDLDPRFVGNDRIKEEKLREWAMLFDREQIYVHEADNIRRRIENGYRQQGYRFAQVDYVIGGPEGQAGATADVIFRISEGPKVRVTKITVEGNENLPDTGWGLWRGGLRKLAEVETKGVGALRWWGKPFVEERLAADLVAMLQVYRDRGFADVRIAVDELIYSEDRSKVHVKIIVDEGPLYRVRSVSIEALEREWDGTLREWRESPADLILPEEELRELLETRVGFPPEAARIAHDRGQLGRYYGERGYLAQEYFTDPLAGGWQWLEPVYLWDAESHEVDLVLRFVQGRQRSIREVKFLGNLHTRDRVLRREVKVLTGTLANLAEIERGLARVRGTGYFSDQLDLTHPEATVRLEGDPEDPDKVDVLYEVEEGRVVNVNLSGGVTSDQGVLGILSISMKNFEAGRLPGGFWSGWGEIYRKEAFHGNGETFLLDIAPGSQISYYKLFYSHPDIFGSHFDRWTASGQFEDRLRRYRSHDSRRQSINLNLGHLFEQGDFSISFGPQWQEIEIDDVDAPGSVPGVLTRSAGTSEFQGLTFNMRYSSLDNRMSPRKGLYLTWNNTLYGGGLGGDNDLWQSTFLFDTYRTLGSDDLDARPGLYFGGEVGVNHPFGDTTEAHYGERKFYGGASTMRGFDFRGVGPNEGEFAIGGETFLRLTGEYRYPLYTTPIPGTSRRREMLRGFFFIDAAILDPDSFELDLAEHRSAAGFGFALTNPIPLKFNFGFPMHKGLGDDVEVFSFRLDLR